MYNSAYKLICYFNSNDPVACGTADSNTNFLFFQEKTAWHYSQEYPVRDQVPHGMHRLGHDLSGNFPLSKLLKNRLCRNPLFKICLLLYVSPVPKGVGV